MDTFSDGRFAARVIDPSELNFLPGNAYGHSRMKSSDTPLPEELQKMGIGSADPRSATLLEELQTMTIEPAEPSDGTSVEELRKVRLKGNQLFAEKNWLGAVDTYSECIRRGLRKLEKNGSTKMASAKDLKCILKLAYSNRAEARLRLQHHEDALRDAGEALELEPKHVKTLVRQGKAAHALGFFEKSCRAFKAALDESPQDQSIEENLVMSTRALIQSRTGEYDLLDYYLSLGEGPACADFVGPVEIRRVSYGIGGRGLFATRRLQAGDILVVSNPLAVVCNQALGSDYNFTDEQTVGLLVEQLRNKNTTSKRHTVQLCSLARLHQREMEIPSMELFRPGSEWLPPGSEKLKVDSDLISDVFLFNLTSWKSREGSPGCSSRSFTGIWALPSFVNHSCAPNCLQSFVSEVIFVRASRDIQEGEELTMSYIPDVCSNVKNRRAVTLKWLFKCRCERCQVEEIFNAKLLHELSKIKTTSITDHIKSSMNCNTQKLSKTRVVSLVEKTLQSCEFGPKERCWIQATFIDYYFDQLELFRTVTRGATESKIQLLNVMLDAMTSVCALNRSTAELAHELLDEVEQLYSKNSESYRRTFGRVLGVYKVYFGKLPLRNLHKLIEKYPNVYWNSVTSVHPDAVLTGDDIDRFGLSDYIM